MELEAITNTEIITGLIIILITLAAALKFTVKEKSTEIKFVPTSEAATKVQKYEGAKTLEAVQWTGENIQDVWETVRCCATRETAFPGDYFIKPKVSSPLQIIEVMGKEYFEENYRIKQDNSMRNSENGQIRED